MIESRPLSHGSATTFDEDYIFLDRPRRAIVFDWTIHRYRWVVMQPLATSRNRVTPADPDTAMAADPWEDERGGHIGMAVDEHIRQVARRQVELQKLIVAFLMAHGMAERKEIAHAAGVTINMAGDHLARKIGTIYCKVYRGRQRYYGIKGVHDVGSY